MPEAKYNLTEKRRLLLDRRLEIIEYPKDEEHSQVNTFFKKLHALILNIDPSAIPNLRNIKLKKDVLILSTQKFYTKHDEMVSNVIDEKFPGTTWMWFHGLGEVGVNEKMLFGRPGGGFSIVIMFFDKEFMKVKEIERLFELLTLREVEEKAVIIPIAIEFIDLPQFIKRRVINVEGEITKELLDQILSSYIDSDI